MAKQKQSPRRRLPIWATTLIVLFSCILLLILLAFVAVNVVLSKISRPELEQSYITESELTALDLKEAVENHGGDTVYPTLDPSEIQWTPARDIDEAQLVNILLIGEDARPGETRSRSDSMILLSFNRDTGNITMTSFLRDLYVQIPGYQDNRLNAAYAFGGMELLDETLKINFGITVDANLSVNFDGFSQIIDLLGGVSIELSQGEADILGLSPGMQQLDGDSALSYARIRSLDSDFGRTARQRKVLRALFDGFKSTSLGQANSLINDLLPMITTDMTNMEIISYAAELIPMLSGATLSSCTIPADNTYTYNTIREMAVIVADFDANRSILQQALTK